MMFLELGRRRLGDGAIIEQTGENGTSAFPGSEEIVDGFLLLSFVFGF